MSTVLVRNNSGASGASGSSAAVTITSTTAGRTLVIATGLVANGNITSITDNIGGQTYTQVPGVRFFHAPFSLGGDMYIANNVAAGITSVTINADAACLDSLYVFEIDDAVLDTASAGTFNATAVGCAVNNTDAGALMIEATQSGGSDNPIQAPWTEVTTVVNGNTAGWFNPGDTAGRTPNFTGTSGNIYYAASFKTPAAGGNVLMGQCCT